MPIKLQRGFTLIEVLVSLVLITLISVAVMGSLGPWLSFKEKLDTQKKLTDAQAAITLAYTANAMSIDSNGAQVIQLANGGQMVSSAIQNGRCVNNLATWQAISSFLPEGPTNSSLDGFQQPLCVFISNQLSTSSPGATLYYHVIAIVSLGTAGVLNPGTNFNYQTGALNTAGDNTGILVNGYAVQSDKLAQTQKTLDKLSSAYETYFTSQYLSTASRDVTIDYFSNASDPNGSIPSTGGQWQSAYNILQGLGIGPKDAQSPYEQNNTILVGNYNESLMGTTVRSNVSYNGQPPFTAMLAAPVPSPDGEYLIEIVNGNY